MLCYSIYPFLGPQICFSSDYRFVALKRGHNFIWTLSPCPLTFVLDARDPERYQTQSLPSEDSQSAGVDAILLPTTSTHGAWHWVFFSRWGELITRTRTPVRTPEDVPFSPVWGLRIEFGLLEFQAVKTKTKTRQ